MNQDEFFQQHQVNGQLSDQHMAEYLLLPSGETSAPAPAPADEGSATPGAAAAPAPAAPAAGPADGAPPAPAAPAASPAPATEQVILAKDGVHTIPYETLEEARKAEQAARAEADRHAAEAEALRKQLAQATAPAPAPAAPSPAPGAPAPAPADEKVSFGDYSDESIAKAVEQIVDRRTASLQTELEALRGKLGEQEKQAEVDAASEHWTTIYGAHPDLDSILESREFAAWKESLPAYARPGIEQTLEQGTAPQVVELFRDFKQATGKTTAAPPPPAPAAAPAADPAAAAAAAQRAIDAAKTKPPTSLSEIPAGASAHHDEAAAMAEMSPTALMTKFEGKSPEQIEALMRRVL